MDLANATEFANRTVNSVTAMHVGQLFFDQDLIDAVEATNPYVTNTQNMTLNSEDGILSDELLTSDPFVEYVFLGDTVDEGLLAWISFGVNVTYTRTVLNNAFYYSGGGVVNPAFPTVAPEID